MPCPFLAADGVHGCIVLAGVIGVPRGGVPSACPSQIFLLNGAIDRETSCGSTGGGPLTAADMVQAAAGGAAGCWQCRRASWPWGPSRGACLPWRSNGGLATTLFAVPLRAAYPHPHAFTDRPPLADALNRRASKRTHRLAFPASVYVTAVLVPAGSPVVVDRPALERLGVRQIVEVPSVPSPDGRGVHFDPDGLVAAVATVIATHRAAQQRQAAQAQSGWLVPPPAGPTGAELTRRNSV